MEDVSLLTKPDLFEFAKETASLSERYLSKDAQVILHLQFENALGKVLDGKVNDMSIKENEHAIDLFPDINESNS